MSRPLVHLVDDDPDALELLRSYLEHAGIDTVQSQSGKQALAKLADSRPDLVLLDVQMPELDGFETLAEMRTQVTLRDLPVIFLTSLDRPNLKVRALDMGADDYVVKPFNSAELVARVRAVLRRGHRAVAPSGWLEGDLSRLPLPVLLQTLALVGRTATVRFPERRAKPEEGEGEFGASSQELRRLGLWAWVLLANGRFQTARFGPHRDREAVARLLLCRSGRFETELDQSIEPVSGPGTAVDSLILHLLVELDETRARLEPVGDLDQPVRLLSDESGALTPWFVPDSVATPRKILIRSHRPLPETAAALVAAHREGRIERLNLEGTE